MPRILRPTRWAGLISARVFDRLFEHDLQSHAQVSPIDLSGWLDTVFGPVGAPLAPHHVIENFRSLTRHSEFLCPDHQGIPLVPRLAWTRNRAGASVRLLIIAHAPAAYLLDWALLRPLLRPGDRVIAPTPSARAVIEFVCPAVVPFVRVIPHPMRPLETTRRVTSRAVFLGRLVREKLVHRLVDALAELRQHGHTLTLDVVGPLSEPGAPDESPYVRSLRARIHRLGVDRHVRLLGAVDDDAAKADLLGGARMLVNPSVSLEESFGKSVVEALGCGVPSVVTRWDGLPEVAGAGGMVVPVTEERFGVDVPAAAMAAAMEKMHDDAPSESVCREQARQFHPDRVGPRYRRALEEALEEHRREGARDDLPGDDEPAAPERGLLSVAAPLTVYSWKELFDVHVEEFDFIRREVAGQPRVVLSEGGHVRTRLFLGQRGALQRLLAGLDAGDLTTPTGEVIDRPAPGTRFLDRMALAAVSRGNRSSRVVCLDLLSAEKRTGVVRAGLGRLRSEGLHSPGMEYLEIEILLQEGDAETAFARSVGDTDPAMWGEHAGHRVCQLARVALAGGFGRRALPYLREWISRFPDGPDAGSVWLALSACAAAAELSSEATTCFERARELLGPGLAVTAVGSRTARS